MHSIDWNEEEAFAIGEQRYRLVNIAEDHSKASDEHLIFKDRSMVARYESLVRNLRPQFVFELGIYKGGSSIFFHQLSQAKKMVAIEISENRIESLDRYSASLGNDSFKAFHGVNQTDRHKIHRIMEEEFDNSSLDLIIDDASHFLEETTESFNLLFPRLRKNGVYVIEDWYWGERDLADLDQFSGKEPLSKLILEIVMACSSCAGMVGKIEINRNSVFVWRGQADIEEAGFSISECAKGKHRSQLK